MAWTLHSPRFHISAFCIFQGFQRGHCHYYLQTPFPFLTQITLGRLAIVFRITEHKCRDLATTSPVLDLVIRRLGSGRGNSAISYTIVSFQQGNGPTRVCNCTSVEHSGGKISRPLLMFLKAMAQRLGELWRIRFRKILRGPHRAWCSSGSKSPWSRWLKFSVREATTGNLLTAVDAGNEEVERAHRRCSSFDTQFPRSFDMQITTRYQACLK